MPIECFREILAQADSTELKEGKSWYPEARKKLEKISSNNQVPLETVVGVCAVLSPQVEWSLNLKSAERFIRNKGKAKGIPGYKRNRDKAKAILQGDYSCIRGPKVEAFFQTILNPSHSVAVVDSQMIGAFYSGETEIKDIKTVSQSPKRLQGIREAIKALAEEREERVSTVQAQIWLIYKRLKGKYCNQLKLWR